MGHGDDKIRLSSVKRCIDTDGKKLNHDMKLGCGEEIHAFFVIEFVSLFTSVCKLTCKEESTERFGFGEERTLRGLKLQLNNWR